MTESRHPQHFSPVSSSVTPKFAFSLPNQLMNMLVCGNCIEDPTSQFHDSKAVLKSFVRRTGID